MIVLIIMPFLLKRMSQIILALKQDKFEKKQKNSQIHMKLLI